MAPARKKARKIPEKQEDNERTVEEETSEAPPPVMRKVEEDDSEEEEDEECEDPTWTVKDELVKEEERIRAKNEAKFLEEKAWEKKEEMSREERYERLMDLLGKSQFYSNHLKEKLQNDSSKELKEEMLKNRKNRARAELSNGSSAPSKESKKRKRSQEDDDLEENGKSEDDHQKKPRLFEGGEVPEEQPLLVKGGVMRDYQIKGYQWMSSLWENGINGILADEMGLGKTLQTIALFAHLIEMGVGGPFLIVAPLSTVPNWVKEFQRFTPDVPVVLYHGSKTERNKFIRKAKTEVRIPEIKVGVKAVFVTSYEIAMNDRPVLQYIKWKYIVVDEGHRLKNMHCRLIKELRRYSSANKLLLTGTPLQNNLSELWSLLNFLMSEIFNDLNVFQSWFNVEEMETNKDGNILQREREAKILSTLHQILTPFLLRRVKSDVDLKIPPKKEVLVYCPMTEHQTSFYKATLDKSLQNLVSEGKGEKEEDTSEKNICDSKRIRNTVNYSELNEGAYDAAVKRSQELYNKYSSVVSSATPSDSWINSDIRMSHKNRVMDLRKITNHPYLIEYPLTEDGAYYRSDLQMIEICGKLKVLDQLLNELIVKRNHKTLIFSQMTRMLDILVDYLNLKGFKFSRLDGSMSFEERQENIDTFSEGKDIKIFLLSTRSGGLGINLTSADTCIIYDSDWNPQQDLQAQDRCHRIGQTKPVMIYRLVTANTIDERIVERAASKRKLEKMVIHEKKFKSLDAEGLDKTMNGITPRDLLELLESKDHAGVVDRKDTAIFTPKEIAALMDRSELSWSKKSKDEVYKVIDSNGVKPALPSVKEEGSSGNTKFVGAN